MLDSPQFSINMTEETLRASARCHNTFNPDTAFPQTDLLADSIQELCSIIAKYNAQSCFRLRLLHRHMTIPEGQILLSSHVKELSAVWTRPVSIADVDLRKIHPHIVCDDSSRRTNKEQLGSAALFPSEFREGPPADLANVERDFFLEFISYVQRERLHNTFGLEVIQGSGGNMIEFSFDNGSLLLDEKNVSVEVKERAGEQIELQETGWTVAVKDGIVYKTGETRCVTFPNGHIKVTDSKITNPWDAMKVLRNDGILI